MMTLNPVTCRDGENDAEDRVIGIIAQADLALKDNKPERVSKTVAEISKTSEASHAA
jgi:hypothetical protein